MGNVGRLKENVFNQIKKYWPTDVLVMLPEHNADILCMSKF